MPPEKDEVVYHFVFFTYALANIVLRWLFSKDK